MSLGFSKSNKLLSRREFTKLFRDGQRFIGKFLVIEAMSSQSDCPKLGITVSRKFGNAIKRNTFKRIVRETYRHILPNLAEGLLVNVRPRTICRNAENNDISRELKELIEACSKISQNV